MQSVHAKLAEKKAAMHTTVQPYKDEVDVIELMLVTTLTHRVSAHVTMLVDKAKRDGNDLNVLYPKLMSDLKAGNYI